MRAVEGIANPAVGLLNIGAEATKGSQLTIAAHEALSDSSLGFIGNVEGSDLFLGDADVVVTDGFTGNVALKLAEGMATAMFAELRDAARRSLPSRLGGQLMGSALGEIRRRLDYRQYGGARLLGVNGIVIVGHGRSDAEAVANAVRTAATAVQQGMLEALAGVGEDEVAGEPARSDALGGAGSASPLGGAQAAGRWGEAPPQTHRFSEGVDLILDRVVVEAVAEVTVQHQRADRVDAGAHGH